MKEWILRRDVVSFGTAVTATVVCAVLAVIVTWAVLDGPAQDVIVDNGSVADWLAVFGTIAVGAGAYKYARATHFHTLDRADAENEKYLRNEIVVLSLAMQKANKAVSAHLMWKVLSRRKDPQSGLVHSAIRTMRDEISILSWAEGGSFLFNEEAGHAFENAMRTFISCTRRCEIMLGAYPDKPITLTQKQKDFLSDLKDVADEVQRDGEALVGVARARLRELKEQLENLTRSRDERRARVNWQG